MNNDQRYLIDRVIALPLAYKVFSLDRKQFEDLYIGTLWLDVLESIMARIQLDIKSHKEQLYNEFGIIVQEINKTEYKIMQGNQSKTVSFSPDELKSLTKDVMADYLYGSNARSFNIQERIWKIKGMLPPDVDLN